MFSDLDLELRPGIALGLFELGSSLWTVLDLLRHNNTVFPRVDVKFATDTPCTSPVILHIHPHLDLLFSGIQQRLHTISLRRLYDPNPPVTVRYKDEILSSAKRRLRRVDVSRVFGPTYAGEGLRYPGVEFSFEEDGLGIGVGPRSVGTSVGFVGGSPGNDDRAREVKQIIVTQTKSSEPPLASVDTDAFDDIVDCPSMHGSLWKAIVKVHEGVTLHFYPSDSDPLHIRIGETTAQDLTCDLGPPLRVFHKEDDRMAIHSSTKPAEGEPQGYFYNYFQHGIDFLISGSSHTVEKVILHTNIPGSPMFQRYQRCPWEIAKEPDRNGTSALSFSAKFESASQFLDPAQRELAPSMFMERGDEDKLTLPGSTTRLNGFEGIVLEVTEAGDIATVMLV